MHFYTKWRPGYAPTVYKIIRVMKLAFILLLTVFLQSSFAGYSQELTISKKNISLEQLFKEIRKQTGYNVLYDGEALEASRPVSVNVYKASMETVLRKSLEGQQLQYRITNNTIVISPLVDPVTQRAAITLFGKVMDENSAALPGASVWEVGTKNSAITTGNGSFSITVADSTATLEVRYIGFITQRLPVKGGKYKNILLKPDAKALNEVSVSVGLFDRKVSSFTGAISTFTGKDLKVVTNQNIIAGLAILDPSFVIVEDTRLGSDPNRLPDVQIRGQTGFPDVNNEYANAPNQPLFILDGFETTLQRIYDMNMNLIKSVTLLKDASAKAIYGSKAGNGVVIIETISPQPGALRVSYSGSLNVTAPDLSSYRLTNSAQKIQAELLAGRYNSADPIAQAGLTAAYASNQKAMLEGVDSYWLSQPLQNGYGQRHNVSVDGGDQAFRYSATMSYNNTVGVMKGSDRSTVSGIINLAYRVKQFSFSNLLTIDRNVAKNSPYGSFAEFSKMNPYWRITDDNGNLIPSYTTFNGSAVYNPLYNGSLNSKDNSKYTNIVENFYAEWTPITALRFTGRVGLNMQNNNSELFVPANNTRYANVSPSSPLFQERGQYTVTNGNNSAISSDLGAAYTFERGKHQVLANAIYSLTQNITNVNGMTAVGFPNDNLDFISAGYKFPDGSRPTGMENTARTLAVTTAVNYAYDNRFLTDLSYRANASSQFGANNRWGSFWSVGMGWNLHNEAFMKNISAIDLFKIRASIGSTGTQNFSAYDALTSYRYNTSRNYNGDVGFNLISLANPDLQWQKVMDKNIGVDIGLFRKLNFRFDAYIKDTKNLLSDQVLPSSAGFSSYKENIGEVRNQGFQVGANMRVYNSEASRTTINVFVNAAHNTNKIRKVSSSLEQLNAAQDADKLNSGTTTEERALRQNPSTRYVPGQSMTAIWVVPSLGIDPSNGKEIFVKKDGTQTYVWSTDDYVVGGDTNPFMNGTFGSNMRYKNLNVSFAFTFRLGGQAYNNSLVQKVENADFNYNVDVRALEQRWSVPGVAAIYKDIADITPTKPTSRFVQDLNEMTFSSISIGYDFNKPKFLGPNNKSRINVGLNLNDVARIGTVKAERGLDYPFARTISMSVQANF
jgi:TonB-linked SusC/RagA family outer membrane protein